MGLFSKSSSSVKDISYGRFLGPLHADERKLEQDSTVSTTRRRVFIDSNGKATGDSVEVSMGAFLVLLSFSLRAWMDQVERDRAHPLSSRRVTAFRPSPADEDLKESRDWIFYKTWSKIATDSSASRPGEGKDVCLIHGSSCSVF